MRDSPPQFTLRTLLLVMVPLAGLFAVIPWLLPRDYWMYDGDFHAVIASADRIRVLDNRNDRSGTAPDCPVLFEAGQPREVAEVLNQVQFEKKQDVAVCLCAGFPVIEWYQGKACIARASVQHGKALRWDQFDSDAKLTSASSKWLQSWLNHHGVPTEPTSE